MSICWILYRHVGIFFVSTWMSTNVVSTTALVLPIWMDFFFFFVCFVFVLNSNMAMKFEFHFNSQHYNAFRACLWSLEVLSTLNEWFLVQSCLWVKYQCPDLCFYCIVHVFIESPLQGNRGFDFTHLICNCFCSGQNEFDNILLFLFIVLLIINWFFLNCLYCCLDEVMGAVCRERHALMKFGLIKKLETSVNYVEVTSLFNT